MIPDFQSLMLPVLRLAEKEVVQIHEAIAALAEEFNLSPEEREKLLPSGNARIFHDRFSWAKTYLKQAGLLTYPKRGVFVATEEGRKVLSQNIDRIDRNFLRQYDAFQKFQNRKREDNSKGSETVSLESLGDNQEHITPNEILHNAYQEINSALAAELLERVRTGTPKFFESLIVDLLLAMGYGGASEDAARTLGQSGDNGVDGVVDQDPLGVDQIYVQAKRYTEGNNIGAGDIRDFFGALDLKKVQKGIFFTTSSFSPSAIQTAKNLGRRIVLIDGPLLSKLMIRYNIGCRQDETLHLKKVDEEFFEN